MGWTNASLPDTVKPFSKHEYVQCLGILCGKCMIGGPIKDLWKRKDTGFIPPLRVTERFHLSRDRYLDWVKFVRFCACGDGAEPFDKIKLLIDAWNRHRDSVYVPGTDIVVDESMSQFEQLCDYRPDAMPWTVKIIRKPVPIGCEWKCAACGVNGLALHIELQERKNIMGTKEFCDQ